MFICIIQYKLIRKLHNFTKRHFVELILKWVRHINITGHTTNNATYFGVSSDKNFHNHIFFKIDPMCEGFLIGYVLCV